MQITWNTLIITHPTSGIQIYLLIMTPLYNMIYQVINSARCLVESQRRKLYTCRPRMDDLKCRSNFQIPYIWLDSLLSCLRKYTKQSQFGKQWIHLRSTKFLSAHYVTVLQRLVIIVLRPSVDTILITKLTLFLQILLPSVISNHRCGPMAFFKMGDDVVRNLVVVWSFKPCTQPLCCTANMLTDWSFLMTV